MRCIVTAEGAGCQPGNNVSTASLPHLHHLANTVSSSWSLHQTLWRGSHAKSYLSHYLYDLKTISELILRDTNGLHVCNIILGSGTLAEKICFWTFRTVQMKSNNSKQRGLTNWLYILTQNMCHWGTHCHWGRQAQPVIISGTDSLPALIRSELGISVAARVTTRGKKGHKTWSRQGPAFGT